MQRLRGAGLASRGALLVLALWAIQSSPAGQDRAKAIPEKADDRTIAHVLNRLGFGPRPGDIERVRSIGLAAYIDHQLRPERIDDQAVDARLAPFGTLTRSTRELADTFFIPAQIARREQQRQQSSTPAARRSPAMNVADPDVVRAQRAVMQELTEQKLLRAIYSERQLQEVMVDFWFNHFNVFAGKGPTRIYLTEYERDVLRPHALGKFRDLLQSTAESPAMLFYLDNWRSAAPPGAAVAADPATERRAPRRRPGAIPRPRGSNSGMVQPTATRRPRGLNENYARELMELHTLGVDGGYSQTDVQEVARAFTGWTIANPRQGGSFVFEPRMHDTGEKIVLGHKIKAGGGKSDGERVLDILASHPSTARHIATKLARRFVSDDPPASLVQRAARRFGETGGDIREVLRTILTSPEFFAPAAYRAKTKTPFEFVVSAVRATGIDEVDTAPMLQALRTLGMPLYLCQPPTGYADKAEAWINTGALLNRMNFALQLANGRGRNSTAPGVSTIGGDDLVNSVMAGDISATTAAAVAQASAPAQAIALLLGSPDFQKR